MQQETKQLLIPLTSHDGERDNRNVNEDRCQIRQERWRKLKQGRFQGEQIPAGEEGGMALSGEQGSKLRAWGLEAWGGMVPA